MHFHLVDEEQWVRNQVESLIDGREFVVVTDEDRDRFLRFMMEMGVLVACRALWSHRD